MRLSPVQLLKVAGIVTVVAFCVSGVFRHARHGAGLIVGDIAWYTFLAGLLAVLILGFISLVTVGRRRNARVTS